ncbi:MAG: tyrosine-type recombinase/integrase [Candidatus Bathyarchaeia archaeon]
MVCWGRDGAVRERQKWAEYWRSVELQIPLAVREKITRAAVVLNRKVEKGRLQERRAREYYHCLLKLGVLVKECMDEVPLIESLLKSRFNTSQRQLQTYVTAYNYYREANGIQRRLEIKIDHRWTLPVLPPENTLQASISVARRLWWQAYFRLLYETGARPSEPFNMVKSDINFDKQLVRLGTAKGSGETLERELPISPLLTEQLRTLTANRNSEDYVFIKPYVKPPKPLEYNDALKVMTKIRQQLKQAGYNVRGLVLYAFRHAFATRLYHATKDLALVQRSLGHRSLETTMRYIHLHPDQPRRFDVENCGIQDKEAISRFLAEGWEIALQTTDTVFFKRPRWVP